MTYIPSTNVLDIKDRLCTVMATNATKCTYK